MALLWSPLNQDTLIYLRRSECSGPLRHTFLNLVMYDHNFDDSWSGKLLPMSVIYRIAKFMSPAKSLFLLQFFDSYHWILLLKSQYPQKFWFQEKNCALILFALGEADCWEFRRAIWVFLFPVQTSVSSVFFPLN